MNFWVTLALFGVAQGLFLSQVLFFHRRGNRSANRILAVLIGLFTLRLSEFVGYWIKFFLSYPHFLFTTVAFQFLFGVLLYLYARALTDPASRFRKVDLLHFIPFAAQVMLLLPFYLQAAPEKILILQRIIYTDNPVFSARFFITELLQDLHMLAYTVVTVRLIFRHRRKAAGATPTLEMMNLSWLRNLTLGFGFFILMDMLHLLDLRIFGYQHLVVVDSALLVLSALLIYLVGYLALRQPEVISGLSNLKRAPRYAKSSLTPKKAAACLQKLIDAMENDRLYLRSDLNLQSLSNELSTSPYHLSQVLNERLNQNFFDFVNRYRVEEAKRLLSRSEARHLTILSIAHEVGFNNKASFNAAFKKHTGITPSHFRTSVKPG